MRQVVYAGICALYTLLMCIFFPNCLQVSAQDLEPEEYCYEDLFFYEINSMQEVIVTSCTASATELVIPEKIADCPVTIIQDGAFLDKNRLVSVILPDSIREIGDYAFYHCDRLQQIVIPEQVQRIGMKVLDETPYMKSLTNACVVAGNQILIAYHGSESDVRLPEQVCSIAPGVFENHIEIERITLPNNLKEIGAMAFAGCIEMEECVIPDGLREIGPYAFNSCSQLRRLLLPDTVRHIGNHAFAYCQSLEQVRLPRRLNRIEGALFLQCKSLCNIEIPHSVESLEQYAFCGCSALQEIILPPSVRQIGQNAFARCVALARCVIYNTQCEILADANVIPEQTVLVGNTDSAVQMWASEWERTFEPLDFLCGDVDENGNLDIIDAGMILRFYAMQATGGESGCRRSQLFAADMNQDGLIDILDAAAVLQYYAMAAARLN